jgi:hypothetical protein
VDDGVECSPVTMRITMRTATAAMAANGPPRRRGRWLMESMARSFRLMKVEGMGSGPASSKLEGLARPATGGGGEGGGGLWPASVSRTVGEPEARTELAG